LKKQAWIVSIVIVAVVALATWWFLATFKYVTRERDLPSTGEARYNPLYALRLSLRELGQQVDTHARLDIPTLKLQANDMLVLYAPPNGLSNKQLDDLLVWVEGGGHIVVAAPSPSLITEGDTIYTKLGIYPADFEDDCLQYTPATTPQMKPEQLCGNRFFTEEVDWFDWLRGDEEQGYNLGRMYWGKGSITIASSLRFMNNEQLKLAGPRELTYQMLAETMGKGKFHLIYSTDMSPLWLLMLKYGWTLLLPLFLLLVAWLVYRSQRFGPLQSSPVQDRRALLPARQARHAVAHHSGHGFPVAIEEERHEDRQQDVEQSFARGRAGSDQEPLGRVRQAAGERDDLLAAAYQAMPVFVDGGSHDGKAGDPGRQFEWPPVDQPAGEVDRLGRVGDEAESRQRNGQRDREQHGENEQERRQRIAAAQPVAHPPESRPGRQAQDRREEERGEERPDDEETADDQEGDAGDPRVLLETAGIHRESGVAYGGF